MENNCTDLDLKKIKTYLKKQNQNIFNIIIINEIESTNSFLKYNNNILENNTVLIANKQSSGRGRRNKSFLSNDSKGVYFSFLIKDKTKNYDPSLITIAMALLVSDTLDSIYNIKTNIKWVNDIYLNDKKICGILSEGKYNTIENKYEYFIIGIGINVNNRDMPEEIIHIASSLLIETKKEKEKNLIIGKIINNFYTYLNLIENNRNSLIELYKSKMLYINNQIKVINGNKTYFAKLIDLNQKGEIKILDENKNIKYLNSGEIQIKLTEV